MIYTLQRRLVVNSAETLDFKAASLCYVDLDAPLSAFFLSSAPSTSSWCDVRWLGRSVGNGSFEAEWFVANVSRVTVMIWFHPVSRDFSIPFHIISNQLATCWSFIFIPSSLLLLYWDELLPTLQILGGFLLFRLLFSIFGLRSKGGRGGGRRGGWMWTLLFIENGHHHNFALLRIGGQRRNR